MNEKEISDMTQLVNAGQMMIPMMLMVSENTTKKGRGIER